MRLGERDLERHEGAVVKAAFPVFVSIDPGGKQQVEGSTGHLWSAGRRPGQFVGMLREAIIVIEQWWSHSGLDGNAGCFPVG